MMASVSLLVIASKKEALQELKPTIPFLLFLTHSLTLILSHNVKNSSIGIPVTSPFIFTESGL